MVRNKMIPFFAVLVFVSTCALASASESQVSANSTDAVDVARRQIVCTPDVNSPTVYDCHSRGYTMLNTVWIESTTSIKFYNNAITFIPANAFNGLTLMTRLQLNENAITSVPVGLLDTNIALEALFLDYNYITLIPTGLVDNNPALKQLWVTMNPLVCANQYSWIVGTAISSICTSCTVGTPENITVDAVDFWQCFISESPTTVSPTAPNISPTVPPTVSSTVSPTVSPTVSTTTVSPTVSTMVSPTVSPSADAAVNGAVSITVTYPGELTSLSTSQATAFKSQASLKVITLLGENSGLTASDVVTTLSSGSIIATTVFPKNVLSADQVDAVKANITSTPIVLTINGVNYMSQSVDSSVLPPSTSSPSPTVSPSADAAASSIKHNVPLIAGMVVLCIIIIGIV